MFKVLCKKSYCLYINSFIYTDGVYYYNRMKQKDLMSLKTRKIIYNYILKNPGAHFREISRENNIPLTTINYHLRYLQKYNLLDKKYENGYA